MGTGHRFGMDGRGGDAFDWLTPATNLGIPWDEARALYEEALHQDMYSGTRSAEELYRESLAARQVGVQRVAPGKVTRTMRLGQGPYRQPARRPSAPGKRTRTAYLDDAPTRPLETVAGGGRPQTISDKHDRTATIPLAARAHRALGAAARPATIFRDVQGDGAVAPHARALVDRALHSIAESLDPALRARLEELIGRSLSDVRVHRDAAADEAALALGARAFAFGHDIFFRERAYDPFSIDGQRLITHEVAHTQQAAAEAAGGELRVSSPGDPAEREADALASSFIEALSGNHRVSRHKGITPSAHRTAIALTEDEEGRWVGAPMSIPEGGESVNEIGIVMHDGAPPLRLRGSPSTTDDNTIGSLPFNTRVQIIKRFPGDWLFVSTSNGRMGYCAATYVWSAPEHLLPEPDARLHRVGAGTEGTAIAIAQQHFADVADDWGQDLRFYVNVIAAVNQITVPSSVDGWRSIAFRAGQLIWIPSHELARSMIGRVSSGSHTYEAADALGIAGAIERAGELVADFRTAIDLAGQYIPEAVARHAEESIINILQSLMLLAVGAVALLAAGALIGALVGGPGGAAVGFELALAFIEWLGLAFLLAWLATSVVRIGSAFSAFIGTVWNARGDREALELAAMQLAEAIGVLVGVLIEAIVIWAVGVGLSRAVAGLRNTAIGRAFGETRLGTWLGERIARYRSGETTVPGPREAALRVRARSLAPRLGLSEAEALALLRAMDSAAIQRLHDEFGAEVLRVLAGRSPTVRQAFAEALRVTGSDATARASLMEGLRLNERGTLPNSIFEQALTAYTQFRARYGERVSGDFLSRFWRSLSQRMDPRQAETEIRLAEDLLAGRTPLGETTGVEAILESTTPGVRVPEYRATTPEGARLVESKAIGEPGQPITETAISNNARSANAQIRTQAQATGEAEGGLIRLDGRDAGSTNVTPETLAEWVSRRIPSPRSSRVTRWVEIFYRNADGQLMRVVLELEGTRFTLRTSEAVR